MLWILHLGHAWLVLGFALRPKPADLYRDKTEEQFWRSLRKSPSETFSDVRYSFRQLDRRELRLTRYSQNSPTLRLLAIWRATGAVDSGARHFIFVAKRQTLEPYCPGLR